MSPISDIKNPIFQSITDKQAILTKEKIANFPKASFSLLKALYSQYSDLAKEEKEKTNDGENLGGYDEKLAQLLACEYFLRKSPDKKAQDFVNLHKPRYNFTFDLANDDIDELNKKIDDPTFDWKKLKEQVVSKEQEELNQEQSDFLKDLSIATDMTPKVEGINHEEKGIKEPEISSPSV